MSGETVFTVGSDGADPAQRISLADAGLKERQDLQEWVMAHPRMLGEDLLVVTFEFDHWLSSRGGVGSKDRLDVLALDREGHLVVVELKRGEAPDTVDMQGLKYAALASRFTLRTLTEVYARHLRKGGATTAAERSSTTTDEEAEALLLEWAPDLGEETLAAPRLMLMASGFPRTVTATVVYLHQSLGMDVRLVVFQAYRTTTGQVVLTVSQHYPPPDVEEFVLTPAARQDREDRARTGTQRGAARDTSTVARLIDVAEMEAGEPLTFTIQRESHRDAVQQWLDADPRRGRATWQDSNPDCLVWDVDGASYSASGLGMRILEEAGTPVMSLRGALWWTRADGRTLVDVVRDLPEERAAYEAVVSRLPEALQAVFDDLDQWLQALEGVTLKVRARVLAYRTHRNLVILHSHADHLSLYVHSLEAADCAGSPVHVGTANDSLRLAISSAEDLPEVKRLLTIAYDRQQAADAAPQRRPQR